MYFSQTHKHTHKHTHTHTQTHTHTYTGPNPSMDGEGTPENTTVSTAADTIDGFAALASEEQVTTL